MPTVVKPEEFKVIAEYINQLLALLEEKGFDAEAELAKVDINASDLEDTNNRIDIFAYMKFLERAISLYGNHSLGTDLGARLTLSTHGFLGYAAMSSETLSDAIELAVKYFKTRVNIFEISFFLDGDAAVLQIDEMVSNPAFLPFGLESMYSSFFTMGLQLVDGRFSDVGGELRFTYEAPTYVQHLEQRFDVPLRFECANNQMRFDAKLLDIPLSFADPRLANMAEERCAAELTTLEQQSNILGRVRRIILSDIRSCSNLNAVSDQLFMSPRTLKRKLKQVGTSFQIVLDSVRKGVAVEYLTQTHKTVDEIANLLGYSDPSNFGRAFKKWTGKRPSEYRRS